MRKFTLFIAALCAVSAMATEGALSGKFSVSATKQVVFSQGNLQYQASTYIWQFAANQYDMVGLANDNIAADYSGWIDMFGWGTGNDPLKLSDDEEEYTVFNEWGANAISNGGDAANLWRTLTAAEMAYLFRSRTNAANLVGYAMIGSQHGLVVLPDDWTLPEGASFFSITDKGLVWDDDWYCGGYTGGSSDHYEDNIYTTEQWETLETAGAVFLPMAGMRTGTMNQNNYLGNYWTSTDGNHALVIRNDGFLPPVNDNQGYYGCSVRLVQDVKEEITAVHLTFNFPNVGEDLPKGSIYPTNPLFNNCGSILVPPGAGYEITQYNYENSAKEDPEEDQFLANTPYYLLVLVEPLDGYAFPLRAGTTSPDVANMDILVNEVAPELSAFGFGDGIFSLYIPFSLSATAISQPSLSQHSTQKILRDGQLLITRDGKTFTAQGVEVR